MDDGIKRQEALVLFSGGKDSFLAAVRLVWEGYRVVLLSANNGSICGENVFTHGAKRLMNKYGENRVYHVGVCSTAAIIMRMSREYADMPFREMAEKWPYLTGTQLNCLRCQSAMWVNAMAYCRAKGIHVAASGYQSTDRFCTGMEWYTSDIRALGHKNGIEVRFPVWKTDWHTQEGQDGRDREMLDYGFLPSVHEPKCMLGMPASGIEQDAVDDLMSYFHDGILPRMQGYIDHMVPIFENIRLSGISMNALDYPIPNGSNGLY